MARPFSLTPTEALVLLDPNGTRGRDALKMTLTALMAERRVAVQNDHRTTLFGRNKFITGLRAEPGARRGIAPHVAVVLDLIDSGATAPTMEDVVKRARAKFGADFGSYVRQHVAPPLISRGLLAEAREPFLLIFTRTRLHHTAAGAAERDRLNATMREAREIPWVMDDEPAKAAIMAAALGPLVLLLPELRPHLRQLSDTMRPRDGGSGDSGSGIFNSGSPSGDDTRNPADQIDQSFDLGAFDFASLDTSAFDSIDAGMSAFDSSASSDGDGGGGGGDGGGGGGGGGD